MLYKSESYPAQCAAVIAMNTFSCSPKHQICPSFASEPCSLANARTLLQAKVHTRFILQFKPQLRLLGVGYICVLEKVLRPFKLRVFDQLFPCFGFICNGKIVFQQSEGHVNYLPCTAQIVMQYELRQREIKNNCLGPTSESEAFFSEEAGKKKCHKIIIS